MSNLCPTCWGSHGCDLPPGHDGTHLCLSYESAPIGEPQWVWTERGGWCNFWEGKQLVFFLVVCSSSKDSESLTFRC